MNSPAPGKWRWLAALIFAVVLVGGGGAVWQYCARMERAPVVSAFQPRISPDGAVIAYEIVERRWITAENRPATGGPWTIWLQDSSTGRRHAVLSGSSGERPYLEPWDRQGRWLPVAIYNYQTSAWRVVYLSPEGTTRRIVKGGPARSFLHTAGERAVFAGWPPGMGHGVYCVGNGSGPAAQVMPIPNALYGTPWRCGAAWDDRVAVFNYDSSADKPQPVAILDLAARSVVLTTLASFESPDLVWSDDGRTLFAAVSLDTGWRLQRLDLASGKVTDLMPPGAPRRLILLAVEPGPVVWCADRDHPEKIFTVRPFGSMTPAADLPHPPDAPIGECSTWGRSSGIAYAAGSEDSAYHIYWWNPASGEARRLDPPSPRERYEASWLSRAYGVVHGAIERLRPQAPKVPEL